MDFRHLIVTCLFSKLRLPFDNQKVKENYAIFINKKGIFSKCPYKQKPEEENLLFLLPVLFVSFLSSYFPSISFNSSSTAAFNCVSSPFTTVSGELATLISGSNCEFSR